MSQAPTYSSDIAFTPTVKAIQARRGSRQSYGRMEEKGGWQTDITDDLAAFIAAQRSLYIATANAEGALHPTPGGTTRLSQGAGPQDPGLRRLPR